MGGEIQRGTWVGDELLTEDGEVLQIRGEPEGPLDNRLADWVLDEILKCESGIVGIEVYGEAINKNLQTIIRQHQRRAEYLRWKFGAALESLAKDRLKGGKGRTFVLPHGTVSFRKVPGRTVIADMGAAVAFAKSHDPGLVRVAETVQPQAALDLWRKKGDGSDVPPWAEVIPPRDSVTVATGSEAVAESKSKNTKRG
jgi:hypothetical protein